MAGNKKEHTRDIGTRCSEDEAMRSGFLSVTWYHTVHGKTERRSQTNIANKLPIQFSYAENTATPLLRSAISLFLRILESEFRSALKKVRPSSSLELMLCRTFSAPSSQICRCSFDNDGVKCKYYRVRSLQIRSP